MAGGLGTGKQASGNHLLLVRNINYFLILGLLLLISNFWGPGIGAEQGKEILTCPGVLPPAQGYPQNGRD